MVVYIVRPVERIRTRERNTFSILMSTCRPIVGSFTQKRIHFGDSKSIKLTKK